MKPGELKPSVSQPIPESLSGERVDRAVAMLSGLPRTIVATMIERGCVRIDGAVAKKASQKVLEGQDVSFDIPDAGDNAPVAEDNIEFEIIYDDDAIVVIDKPEGLVVHPGAGNRTGTLVHGLLARYPDLAIEMPGDDPTRPGIVHRLDAGTSGLLVVARTKQAHVALVSAMKQRTVERRYLGLAWGDVQPDHGMIDAPIGRGEADPTKMAVNARGRIARTRYEVLARHDDPSLSLVAAQLETGRTHQIRVHLAAIGHPIVGDRRYGGVRQGVEMGRPFLHARSLRFVHPQTGEEVYFESKLPKDLKGILNKLGVSGFD